MLRWAENPADRVTGFRVLQLMEGIGPAIAGKVLDAMTSQGAIGALAGFRPPARATEPWRELVLLFQRLHDRAIEWPAELDLVRRWYQPHIEQRYDDAIVRAADLDQLARIAITFPSRAKFLTDLTLDPPDAASNEASVPRRDEDYLILSTIHSAKGQDWKAVFVLNAVDGCIPSDMATGNAEEIEEERRLLYVAMTRAKDLLILMLPQRFYTHQQAKRGDRHVYAARSRFIPGAILGHFEITARPAPSQLALPQRPPHPRLTSQRACAEDGSGPAHRRLRSRRSAVSPPLVNAKFEGVVLNNPARTSQAPKPLRYRIAALWWLPWTTSRANPRPLRQFAEADLRRAARLIIKVQDEIDPQFRFSTPEGDYHLAVTLPADNDERRSILERVSAFMTWKQALGFTLASELIEPDAVYCLAVTAKDACACFSIHRLKAKGRLKNVPVFLDSPMAVDASEVFCRNLEDHRLSARDCRDACHVAHYVRDVEESKAVMFNPMPKVIVSASGMATGGRVLHHLKHYAPDARNTILFAGFQTGGTRGRR